MNLHIPDVRILEVHPSPHPRNNRRPSSILEEPKDLGLPLLLQAIRDAAKLGYNFLSIGGQEPLSYPSMPALCREAHRQGMLTSMITRRTRLSAARLEWLRFSIDLIGVEINSKSAACAQPGRSGQTVTQRFELLREAEIPCALVFAMTAENMKEVEWAAEFAVAQGAAMMQVRPAGELTDEQMATAWMMVECLCELHRGKLVIHFDAVNRYSLPTEPEDLASWRHDVEREARYLGEIVSPLVIENDGTVTPMRVGFARRFAFGNLRKQGLARMAEDWIDSQSGPFCRVYGSVLDRARRDDHMFTDLVDMLSIAAERAEIGIAAVG